MSDFSDFDDFLASDDLKKRLGDEEYVHKIKTSHQALNPFLERVFELFKQYNETIIQPRKPHFVILKKHEELKEVSKKARFLYRVNLLPRSLFAQSFNPYTTQGAAYVVPNIVTAQDWYLKVAFQFDVSLVHRPSREIQLTPVITLRTWGDTRSELPISEAVSITKDVVWGKPFLTYEYQPNLSTSEWEQQFKELFILVTPAVLAHTKEVFGVE